MWFMWWMNLQKYEKVNENVRNRKLCLLKIVLHYILSNTTLKKEFKKRLDVKLCFEKKTVSNTGCFQMLAWKQCCARPQTKGSPIAAASVSPSRARVQKRRDERDGEPRQAEVQQLRRCAEQPVTCTYLATRTADLRFGHFWDGSQGGSLGICCRPYKRESSE